ncbi:hypothetical protein H2199_004167 [Coniosporium tulheliwenetii]|uniref:Uncharacterized protein n=1 Tax=Coniosporium tulheliwenetii TaxID=3383036 RepID=A0ACC2Z7G6_9PEZI|nr:hypothetical protein H2199_004167 [Cladosporium sp. JES 115]
METSRPSTALKADAPTPAPVKIQVESPGDAAGEPLVQDFQDRYLPKPQQSNTPAETPLASPYSAAATPQLATAHKLNQLSLSSADGDDESAPAPPDFTRRGIHIPTRTRQANAFPKQVGQRSHAANISREVGSSVPSTPDTRERSSADSVISYETSASSISHPLPPLQVKTSLDESDRLEPLLEDDPRSFDLLAEPETQPGRSFQLEKRSEQMFSREHLETIFADPPLLLRFTSFLSAARPKSVPLLIYYLDALKALRAINYANAIAEALEPIPGHDFTEHPARATVNSVLENKANEAFEAMVAEDLPAYITHVFIQVVTASIQRRITGTLPPPARYITSRFDTQVTWLTQATSIEFHRTTQYGVSYAIGRNCRFLQGPRTNPFSVRRLRAAVEAGKETSEVFLNYRRDGSPFLNLLMMAPLMDSRGRVRYFIGAQVDVSGLAKDCTDLEGLQRMLAKQQQQQQQQQQERDGADTSQQAEHKDEFQELSEMFNMGELETVRKYGGRMHREHVEEIDDGTSGAGRPRLLLKDPSNDQIKTYDYSAKPNGKLEGIYQHYLLIRPYPSLRILFTSPSLRVPGILQSPFLSRIGGSSRVHDELEAALAAGRGVTAKIRWLSGRGDDEGRSRWIHCTPLLGHTGAVGVWMVVLLDDGEGHHGRRFRMAPPIPSTIGNHHHVGSGKGEDRYEGHRKEGTPRRRDGERGTEFPSEISSFDGGTRADSRMSERERERRYPRPNSGLGSGQPSLESFALG